MLISDRGRCARQRAADSGAAAASIIYGDELNPTAGNTLVTELRMRGDSVTTFRLSPSSGPASYDSAQAVIAKAPVAIFAVAVRAFAGRGTIGMPDLLARLADSTARTRPTVFVSLGSPYVGAQVPSLGTYLLGWASNPNTEWAVAAALTGAAISGRMPVPVPPGIALGAGLTLPRAGAGPVGRPYALTCRPVAHRLQAVAAPKKLRRRSSAVHQEATHEQHE